MTLLPSALAARDIAKHLGLECELRDELESLNACLLVAALRAKDARFTAMEKDLFIDVAQVKQRAKKLRAYCELVSKFEALEAENTIEAWRSAEALCDTYHKILTQRVKAGCQVRLASCLRDAQGDGLVQASEILKLVLLRDAGNAEAWIERGRVFLAMQVPLLALLHFTQPCVVVSSSEWKDLSIALQQNAQDVVNKQFAMTLEERRVALAASGGVQELLARANLLLTQEAFYSSAALYFAACLQLRGEDCIVQCLLGISACWREKKDEAEALQCMRLCEYAYRLLLLQQQQENTTGDVKQQMNLILRERAKVWLALRQYSCALLDLNEITTSTVQADEELEQLKRHALQLQLKPRPFPWGIELVLVDEHDGEKEAAHRFFGSIPANTATDNARITVLDLRARSGGRRIGEETTMRGEDETRLRVTVGPGFFRLPRALDYFVMDEDVLWTWPTLIDALAGLYEDPPCSGGEKSLTSLLLKRTSLHHLLPVVGSATYLDLEDSRYEYVANSARQLVELPGDLLRGILLPIGPRELRIVNKEKPHSNATSLAWTAAAAATVAATALFIAWLK